MQGSSLYIHVPVETCRTRKVLSFTICRTKTQATPDVSLLDMRYQLTRVIVCQVNYKHHVVLMFPKDKSTENRASGEPQMVAEGIAAAQENASKGCFQNSTVLTFDCHPSCSATAIHAACS